jgi:hypothetical protein
VAAAVEKTEQIAAGRLNVTVSASQGGATMPLLAYRYAFNNREKLLAVTVDYRKLVAQQPAASRVGKLADPSAGQPRGQRARWRRADAALPHDRQNDGDDPARSAHHKDCSSRGFELASGRSDR